MGQTTVSGLPETIKASSTQDITFSIVSRNLNKVQLDSGGLPFAAVLSPAEDGAGGAEGPNEDLHIPVTVTDNADGKYTCRARITRAQALGWHGKGDLPFRCNVSLCEVPLPHSPFAFSLELQRPDGVYGNNVLLGEWVYSVLPEGNGPHAGPGWQDRNHHDIPENWEVVSQDCAEWEEILEDVIKPYGWGTQIVFCRRTSSRYDCVGFQTMNCGCAGAHYSNSGINFSGSWDQQRISGFRITAGGHCRLLVRSDVASASFL